MQNSESVQVCYSSACSFIQSFNYTKLCVKWFPRRLKDIIKKSWLFIWMSSWRTAVLLWWGEKVTSTKQWYMPSFKRVIKQLRGKKIEKCIWYPQIAVLILVCIQLLNLLSLKNSHCVLTNLSISWKHYLWISKFKFGICRKHA